MISNNYNLPESSSLVINNNNSKDDIDHFNSLPDELVLEIFSKLNIQDIYSLSLVNLRFYRITNDKSLVGRDAFTNRYCSIRKKEIQRGFKFWQIIAKLIPPRNDIVRVKLATNLLIKKRGVMANEIAHHKLFMDCINRKYDGDNCEADDKPNFVFMDEYSKFFEYITKNNPRLWEFKKAFLSKESLIHPLAVKNIYWELLESSYWESNSSRRELPFAFHFIKEIYKLSSSNNDFLDNLLYRGLGNVKKALLYRIVEDSNLKLLKEYIDFVDRNKITPKLIKPSLICSIKQILPSFYKCREKPVPSNDDRENKEDIAIILINGFPSVITSNILYECLDIAVRLNSQRVVDELLKVNSLHNIRPSTYMLLILKANTMCRKRAVQALLKKHSKIDWKVLLMMTLFVKENNYRLEFIHDLLNHQYLDKLEFEKFQFHGLELASEILEHYHENVGQQQEIHDVLERYINSFVDYGHRDKEEYLNVFIQLVKIQFPNFDSHFKDPSEVTFHKIIGKFLLACASNGYLGLTNSLIEEKQLNPDKLSYYYLEFGLIKNHLVVLQDENLAETLYLTNINYQDEAGMTALMYACQNGHVEIVEALLERPDIDLFLLSNQDLPAHIYSAMRALDDDIDVETHKRLIQCQKLVENKMGIFENKNRCTIL